MPQSIALRARQNWLIYYPPSAAVNIPVLVAPLIRVFRPLMFRQIFPWRRVFE